MLVTELDAALTSAEEPEASESEKDGTAADTRKHDRAA